MTSSSTTGERRWAAARRGGMTVLGKVVVPKPINLPSQRLENHGLDPNVEIVPKGTHSWGSKSSMSNAWGSILSPNAESATGSPSHRSGRPSSGESGTRPSSSSSDRAHESIITNAWAPNSRPSSASGALTSNQTASLLRPRSAEPRPASSQLSRFAEPLNDNLAAWPPTSMAEKVGTLSSKNDEFSLASGDFPSLGSEKETPRKSEESQGRPESSSGSVAAGNVRIGEVAANENLKGENPNSWRRNFPVYAEEVSRSSVEKWHTDPQPYNNPSIPPQHYDAWHGPPVNNHPGGVWPRRPPGRPPFVSPMAPGGFPMEPYPPYYRPHMHPAAHPQQVPLPGAGPRGPHPKNGDMYRPQMHDAYIRPGIPLRPGFYPGPAPYEGYYCPPMGYHNSNERDIPFMGTTMGPSQFNNYSSQHAPDPRNSHSWPIGYGPTGPAMAAEKVGSGHPQDIQGPLKVLKKQSDGWEGKDESKEDESMMNNALYHHPRQSRWDRGWGADDRMDEEVDTRKVGSSKAAVSEALDNRSHVFPAGDLPGNVANLSVYNDNSLRKLAHSEPSISTSSEISAVPKDPDLIKKIERLNVKARASDRHEVKPVGTLEEHKNGTQDSEVESTLSANQTAVGSIYHERTNLDGAMNSAIHCNQISGGDKGLESALVSPTATSRRSSYGMHGRADHRNRGRLNTQEGDGWQKKSHILETPNIEPSAHSGNPPAIQVRYHTSSGTFEEPESNFQGKDGGELINPISDPSDNQRAMMKELAKERIKQREKEEEERAREQKAKALAKLEELNRRTQGGDGSSQKLETLSSGVLPSKQGELSSPAQPAEVGANSRTLSSDLGCKMVTEKQSGDGNSYKVEKTCSSSCEMPLKSEAADVENVVHGSKGSYQRGGSHKSTPIGSENVDHKQRHANYRQKQNSPLEKTSEEKLITSSTKDVSNSMDGTSATWSLDSSNNELALDNESSLPAGQSSSVENIVHHRRKSRSGKTKLKGDDASSAVVLPPTQSKDTSALDSLVENDKPKSTEFGHDCREQYLAHKKDANEPSEQRVASPSDEASTRVNSQWKSQHLRRTSRNPQSNKQVEKFQTGDSVVWAPVRSQNQTQFSNEASHETVSEVSSKHVKTDHQVQSNPKNKRAEMERYVPKPVAKEMAQHGTSHQPVVPPINQARVDETSFVRIEFGSLGIGISQIPAPAIGKVASAEQSGNEVGKQNKPRKLLVSESSVSLSNSSMNLPKSDEVNQTQRTDATSSKEQPSDSDEWNSGDGWNMPEVPDPAAMVSVVKDQRMTARGRRQPHKGHKSFGHSSDSEKKANNVAGGKVQLPSSANEIHQTESLSTSKETRPVGERQASHWQPKYQSHSSGYQWVSRSSGVAHASTTVATANRQELDPPSQSSQPPAAAPPNLDQSLSENTKSEEALPVHREAKRERKESSQSDSAPSNTTTFRHEHRVYSSRKNGSQSSRFVRDHDMHADRSGSGKDYKQHDVPLSRQKHSAHYEYQPVGPHTNAGAGSKERGQSHPRRGGYAYRRQASSVQVTDDNVNYD